MPRPILFGTGWRPDPPDERDLGLHAEPIRDLLAGTAIRTARAHRLPASVDLRRWCSPVQFQGHYNTCTAHVASGMLELLETKAHGYYVPASRLFLYQVTKRILGETGDPGVYLRQMMGTVVLVGVPPEKFWPYLDTAREDDPRIDGEPDAFCYAVAGDYGAARYFRLDPSGSEPEEVLAQLRRVLAASIPSSLGFPLYMSSLERAATTGELSFPDSSERPAGSHAALLVGYDDSRRIASGDGDETTGAFLLKNSWGADWGESGYGWLPYRYVTEGLAKDCWTLMQPRWVETEEFQLGLEEENGEDDGEAAAS